MINNIIKNSRNLVKVNTPFKKHPEYNIICDIIFATIYNIEKNGVISLNKFKRDVLSKRDNPKEYYKALINFSKI